MGRIVIGITGASGTIFGIDLLQKLKRVPDVETHLVISTWAKKNLELETRYSLRDIKGMSDYSYSANDQGAKISSGSFLVDSMVIVPASMKTVASVAYGFADNLISRAADVTLKEQRQLIIVPRETPLSLIHLENLTKLAQMGVQVIPPMPAFYNHPQTISDLINHNTMKLLDALGIENETSNRWDGD